MGPLKRDAAPDNVERLDQELSDLEANEPQPGDDTPQIDDPGISPIPGEELLNDEVASLEADEPFDFTKSAGEPAAAPEVGEVDTESPPERLEDYLREIADKNDKPAQPTARQKRGRSRVGEGIPPDNPADQDATDVRLEDAQKDLGDADIRNRERMAIMLISHARKIDEITARLTAARI